MTSNPEGQEFENYEIETLENNELDVLEEEQIAEEELQENENLQLEEEEVVGEEEEEVTEGEPGNSHAETLFHRHKLTLQSYLRQSPKKERKELTEEVQNYVETEPPKIYDALLKKYGPSLLANSERINDLNEKKQKRKDVTKPERMTNDQLRENIQELAVDISNLNNEISELKDSIGILQQQYVVYQQKKKERELAALSAHAKKSSRSPKNKTSANQSPRGKTTKK